MIDEYVHEISLRLVTSTRQRTRIIEDIRDHLDDAVARLVSEGVDVPTAERRAMKAFGTVADLADQFNGHVATRLLRRTPVTMAASGFALVAGFLLAALTPPQPAGQQSTDTVQQVAFFAAVLGLQFAFVAGVRVVARVGARWRTVPCAADHVLVRRAGVVFATGLAVAACGWTVALVSAVGGQAGASGTPFGAGIVVMIAAAMVACVTTTHRLFPMTGDEAPMQDDSATLLGAAERGIQWMGRRPRIWCAFIAAVAGLAALSHAETTVQGSLTWGAIQALAVIGGFVLLGPSLELRSTTSPARG